MRKAAPIDAFPELDQFLALLQTAAETANLVRLALRAPAGSDPALKSINIKPVTIKRQPQLSFTWHYQTNDIIKNLHFGPAVESVKALLARDFRVAHLYTTEADWALDLQGKRAKLKQSPPTSTTAPSREHDRTKVRTIPATGTGWLNALGITDPAGKVNPTAQDKFRQINRYVEILGPLLQAIRPERLLRIVDMGAGKGYLTFAVAQYLQGIGRAAAIVGVERRPELVAICNEIAAKAELGMLHFEEGSIDDYAGPAASVLIALHACDTATDDAIAKGISGNAELIVVAPCCHKQIRREIEAAPAAGPLGYLLQHGIFVERQSEMVTDGIRALVLEYFGYSTKVFEFISDQHTPKNVMIVGTRTGRGGDPAVLARIVAAKAFFGIRRHYLETAIGLDLPALPAQG